jgi:hypothetical protein
LSQTFSRKGGEGTVKANGATIRQMGASCSDRAQTIKWVSFRGAFRLVRLLTVLPLFCGSR